MIKLKRYQNNPILKPNPRNQWEAGAVFNCSVVFDKNVFHLVYRAVASGFSSLPKWGYKNYISSIDYAASKDGINFQRHSEPFIKPEYKWERFGCEDPRIIKFENTYYIFYTALSKPAYSPNGSARFALATTKNFKEIHKYGVIGPDVKSKAAALFPEKINGKIAMIFTWQPDTPFCSIAIASFDSIKQLLYPTKSYWDNFLSSIDEHIVFSPPKGLFRGQETGAPPLKTSKGWLLIYKGPARKKIWSISAALLDLENPQKVIARSKRQILFPEKEYEIKGLIPKVTFPEGTVIVKDKLFVYYGAADKTCCLATVSLNKLIKDLLKNA
ncbi:MAG: glycosidase [Candidatus Portnoybacteria bacterium]|nr:glycosidase [Candidatus Portnoybacteria bacterium]